MKKHLTKASTPTLNKASLVLANVLSRAGDALRYKLPSFPWLLPKAKEDSPHHPPETIERKLVGFSGYCHTQEDEKYNRRYQIPVYNNKIERDAE